MIDYAYHLDLIDLALGELNHISLPLILQDDTHVRCELDSSRFRTRFLWERTTKQGIRVTV